MGSFAFIAIFIGLLTFVGLLLWVRQREQSVQIADLNASPAVPTPGEESVSHSEAAVIVTTAHGQVVHVNAMLRQWLNLDTTLLPGLEDVARVIQPVDNFFHLISSETRTTFRLGSRWVDASSHFVPSADGARMVLTLTEAQQDSRAVPASGSHLDISRVFQVMGEIGETVDASMGMELCLQLLLEIISRAIPSDAGEITLYEETLEFLQQRGWVGDTRYLLAVAEAGGGYHMGEGLAGLVAEQGRAALIGTGSDDVDIDLILRSDLYCSAVAIPLETGGKLIGTLSLFSAARANYDDGDIALLQALSQSVTTAIYNATLYTRQESRIKDIASIQQIVDETADDENSTELYAALNERMARLLDAEMCGIYLFDEDREALIPQLPFFGLQDSIASLLTIPLTKNSPQLDVWLHQQYWISSDIADEPLVESVGLKPIVTLAGIQNTAIYPLQIGEKRIGAVAISNKRGGMFSPSDLQNMQVLVHQAAIVVEHVRLSGRERLIDTELVGLQEMTHAIGALSHEGEFYSEITERIARLTGSAICGILLYDPRSKHLVSQLPFYGVAEHLVHDYRIDVAPGTVMGQLWDEEDFWYSNQVSSYTLFYEAQLDKSAEAMGLETTLFAVMTAGGQRTGLVQVANRTDDRPYTDKDARLLQIFATQAASIIENARLYHEVQLRAEQADKLRQIAEMAGSVLSTEQPFKPVLHEIARFMDSPIVFINVVDSATGTLITYPRWSYGIKLLEPVVQDMNVPGFERSVARSGGYYLSNNLSGETLPASYRNISMRYNLNSLVMVPLVVGDRILGELGVANRNDPYKDDDRIALGTVAAQIASAMDRLLVYEATGENLDHRMRELDAIARISNELTITRDLKTVLEVIREEAEAATFATGSTIALLQPVAMWETADKPMLESRIGTEAVTMLMDIEREAAIRGTEPVLVSSYKDSVLRSGMPGIHSGVAAPIEYQDEVVGLVHVYHENASAFNDRVGGFLMTLAAKASLGYQNYVYYEQQLERGQRLRQRADQLKRIFDLGQMLQNSTDPVEIMEAIAYSVQQSVGFDVVLVTLFDEHGLLHRVAQAGMPLRAFQATRKLTMNLESLDTIFDANYRINDSYFYPIEAFEDWYSPDMSALSVAYEGNRTVESRGEGYWRDGDMLLVRIIGQGGNILGLISLDRPHNNKRPDTQTVEVLEIFAHQASTMLENIRLFMETQRSARQEQRLSEMLESIARTLDMSEIAESVAKGLQGLLPFYRLSLVLAGINGDYHFDYLRATVEEDGEIEVTQELRTTLERTALGRSFDERKTYIYNIDDIAVHHYDDLQVWYARGEESTYVTPLIAGGECLGILHIGSYDPGIMHQADARNLLDRMSQLVASTVQNARLYSQAVDLQVLNRSVVESIQQGIVVLDSSGRILNINDFMEDAYGWDKSARSMDLFAYRPEISEFIKDDLRAVLEKGEPRVRFSQTTPDERTGEPIVRNLYLYPLRFGDQVRGAVMLVEDVTERTRLEEAMEARANQLAALTDVSTRITASLEREEVVNLAIDEMGWIIPYDVMTLWRRNGSYMLLEGHSDFEKHSHLGDRVLISDDMRVQEMVETQKVVSGSARKPITMPFLPDETEIHSWMGVPLVNQGHVVGMMILAKAEPKFYDTLQERNIAFAFASQVAIAQANADLFEQTFERTNELGTLLEAAQATSLTRDVKEVFNIVAELMFSALEMETCSILVWDDVDDELEVQFATNRLGEHGYPQPEGKRYPLSNYPARQSVLRDRDVIAIVDLENEQDRAPMYPRELDELRETGYGARLMVPLVVGDQAIGILQLDHASREEGALTQQNVRMARALGSQVAIAVENAQLQQETQNRFGELLAINTLSQSISSTLHVDDMLPILQAEIPQLTSAEEMYLALYDADNEMINFPLAISHGEPIDIPSRLFNTDEVSYVIKRRHTLNLGSDYFSIDKLRQSMGISNGEGDIKSYMGVPLKSGDEVVGVLAIRSRTRIQAFNINDDRILTTIGTQIGAAIQNARLFERVTNFANDLENLVRERTDELEEEKDRLDTLYQITSELARTLDMTVLLSQALGMLSKAVGAQDGVILLANPATESLHSRAWLNPNNLYYDEQDTAQENPLHPAEGLANWLLIEGGLYDHVVTIDDLNKESYWTERGKDTGMQSALAVLLETGDDPIGVMVLLAEQPGAFTETHLKLLVPAANQVAASIKTADLYKLIRQQAQDLGELYRNSQEVTQKNTAILETITDGVMLADASGKIVLFNSAAERILQIPRDQIMGQPIARLAGMYGTSTDKWMQIVEEWTQNPDDHELMADEYIVDRMELGEYIINIQVAPVYIKDLFLGTVSVFRDITSDVEADRIKSEFIENVSHEFRTPLTPIKGFTEMLLMGAAGELSSTQHDFALTIKENVDRLTVLVNDVLNIAKLDRDNLTVSMRQVELQMLIPEIADMVVARGRNREKDITLTVNVPETVPTIRADSEKLRQILSNLLDNAFNYTPAGGSIDVSAQLEADNRSVLIVVSDTGVGIPPEFHDAAWRRFERYDQHALSMDVAGTGLGLPLVRELVLLHNGDTWLESEAGQGTSVFVRLPVEQSSYSTETIEMLQIQANRPVGD